MMKKILILTAMLIALVPLKAQDFSPTRLSDSAFASILTCGAGDEFYTSFGHSAIRVCDSTIGLDIVYNYGTFDFDIPHFYWTFALGNLNYCLSRESFGSFLAEYTWEGRAVWEQRLRLSPQEVNNLFVSLENNYLPQYRYYLYDFFRDNCATRVRDMVSTSLCHRTLSAETTADTNISYRGILYRSTESTLLWWRLGVDIALGLHCDHRCSNYEYMFSPIEMMRQFDTLTVSDTRQPLAEPAQQLLEETRTPLNRSVSPVLTFWVVFIGVLCLTIIGWKKQWRLRWFDTLLFGLTSLVSIVVMFLWFGTSHYCAEFNLNILWASPFFIYIMLQHKRSAHWILHLQLIMLLAAMIMTIAPLPQQINTAILPITLSLAIRLITLLKQ